MGSFALLILLGTLGLKYLPGLYEDEPLDWLDALFTSTSAVCVTGLIVVDTATYFTTAGQAFLLLLIQLGGLGMLAFASLIIIAFGRRLSLRQEALSTEMREAAPHIDIRQLTIDVVRFTLLLEAIGAAALYVLWVPRFGWTGALWPACFHSVSAFCNAGFSIFSDSLVSFQNAPITLAVIAILIVIGGLGFLTMEELHLRWKARRRQVSRLSLHSRIVIVTTLVLLLGGWILFAFFEWSGTFAHLPARHKLTNALFSSVTARTAGFNTMDYAKAAESSNFLSIILMMIGGSPGSTAGGIKTTTFALIGLLAWSRLKGYEKTTFWGRSVREETTDRAVGLFVLAFGMVVAGVFALTTTEDLYHTAEGNFLSRMFEVVSAFNTVGLSMGVTPSLSPLGRGLVVVLMFCGRVGPLAVGSALAFRRPVESSFRYAYEDVVIG